LSNVDHLVADVVDAPIRLPQPCCSV